MAQIIIKTDTGRTVATFRDDGGEYEAPITLKRDAPPDHDFMEALESARAEDVRWRKGLDDEPCSRCGQIVPHEGGEPLDHKEEDGILWCQR